MKNVIAIILLLHALIHSMGFLQAFSLTKSTPLSTPPSALAGTLWLVASILLFLAVVLWMAQFPFWWIVGGIAVLFSQFLIIDSWAEAKFGTLPNLILLVAIILGFAHNNFTAKNTHLRNDMLAAVRAAPLQHNSTNKLPAPVKKWLNNSGALDRGYPTWVSMSQELMMKLTPAQENWYSATAEQVVTLNPPAFQWTVNMRMNAFTYISGTDRFTEGSGSTLMKLWSLFPVARAENNPKTDEAALQRFLAEMAWYPMAARGPSVTWEPIDHLSAKATILVNGLQGSGTFHFTEAGVFQKFTAQRYYESDSDAKRIPWVIEAIEHGTLDGVEVPVVVRVSWILPEGPWRWLEVRVNDLNYQSGQEQG
ncbi:DUF6920 family protein [Neolewinella persica]|uniref:DUF6920 family protein n=1 Tax=Neolewinella persica TaxID=70998 RepID=UPI00039C8DD1|nr:DUF6544 family protein [Neolewinella persica]